MSEQAYAPTRMRLAPIVAIVVAIAAQLLLRKPVILIPHWIAPTIEVFLLLVLVVGGFRQRRGADRSRTVRFALGGVLAVSATGSAAYLITSLLDRRTISVDQLLGQGVEILVVTVVGFSVLYWQLDRGGPDGRVRRQTEDLAFWFTQDSIREYSDEFDAWQPRFIDYLYLSFTTITAFSPTDTMPLTRTAKGLMMWQSGVSMATLAIVLAFAINSLA